MVIDGSFVKTRIEFVMRGEEKIKIKIKRGKETIHVLKDVD